MAKDKNDFREEARYTHYEQTVVRKIQHFYLSSMIEEPIHYIDMIHRIQTAGPEDIVYIHLNTPGGHLDTGIQLVNAMHSTQAHIIASVEAESHSLGTLIFLAADEFVVHDNCMMMFHNFSGSVGGKGHEQQAHLAATVKWFSTLARKLYVPFLSEDEFDRILKGEDIYIHSEDIRKRLERMVKSHQAQIDSEQKKGTSKRVTSAKKGKKPGRKPKVVVDATLQ